MSVQGIGDIFADIGDRADGDDDAVSIGSTVQMPQYQATPQGPQFSPGPLELLRQREATDGPRPAPRASSQVVERNSDGVPVVTAGFLDGSPS